MSTVVTKNKTALLLVPEHLAHNKPVFEWIHISRNKNGIPEYGYSEVSEHSMPETDPPLPRDVQEYLRQLDHGRLRFDVYMDVRQNSRERNGVSQETYTAKARMRRMHELIWGLCSHARALSMFHRIRKDEGGNIRTAPCRLHTATPSICFEVRENEQGLYIVTRFELNGAYFDEAEFTRTYFLLQKSDEYFVLRYQDYHTLEWLERISPEKYARDPALFASRVLAKLEADYPVDRNGLFDKNQIRARPENCVYVSEISDSFLMLTPKWKYEGILVEGTWKELYETSRNGELFTVYRDRDAEHEFSELLRSMHPSFGRQLNGYYYLPFAEAGKKQWFLKTYHALLEKDVLFIGLEMLSRFRYSQHKLEVTFSITESDDTQVSLKMTAAFGKEKLSLRELQKVLLGGLRSVLLKDNSIGLLDDEFVSRYGVMIKHGHIEGEIVRLPRWIFLSAVSTGAETEQVRDVAFTQEWKQNWMQWQQDEGNHIPLPGSLQAGLRPYQYKGFEWMVLLSQVGAGACLADDMGLGKTLQAISFLMYRLGQQPAAKALIVCPASLIYNWQQELGKFTDGVNVIVYNGTRRDFADVIADSVQIVIATYGTVRAESEQFGLIQWDTVVIDESHNIKNPSAQITRAVKMLQARCRIALSGTPVMNNTMDLYTQLDFLLPGMFGTRDFFRKEYADPIDAEQDREKVKALQQLTAPFILRRTKGQVASDLPEKNESVMWCELAPAQQQVYEKIRQEIRDSVFLNIRNEGISRSKLHILQGIQKLRQVCCSPALLEDELSGGCRESVKIEMLMEELRLNLSNNKVLVFSQFKGMLRLIADACDQTGIPYFHFDGDTPPEKRMEMVTAFQQEGSREQVFLISLKAGNAGLNLTAADYVFLVDPWWNVAVQQQAIDRTHRIGQTKKVFAYKMICKDTIEEKIIELQERKQLLSEELVSADEGLVKNLTEEDVAYLFN